MVAINMKGNYSIQNTHITTLMGSEEIVILLQIMEDYFKWIV